MIEFLSNIDIQVFLFFNGLHLPYLDRLMPLVSAKYTWVPMYATMLYLLFKSFRPRQAMALLLAMVVAVAVSDQVCATLIRPAVERLRPSNLDNPLSAMAHVVGGYRGGSYGFPSCHAANSFAFAAVVALIVRSRRCSMFVFGWAALNSYSRIYLGVHYPGDLFCGAIIGILAGASAYWVACTAARITCPRRDFTSMSVLFTTQAGPLLAPVLGVKVVNIRIFDVFSAVGYTTLLTLCVIAFFI